MKPDQRAQDQQRTAEMARERQDVEPRCSECNKKFAVTLTRPWHVDCPRCGARNERL